MDQGVNILDKNPVSAQAPAGGIQPQVGSLNIEVSPISAAEPVGLKPAGVEVKHKIDQELETIKVEEKSQAPEIKPEDQGIMQHAGPHVPVSVVPSGKKIEMPMSEEEMREQLKTGQDDDSSKGFAKVVDKAMKVLGL